MMDENAPAFVLELEIDDEISFKPVKNKRVLQAIDSNTLPIETPEKKRHNTSVSKITTPAAELEKSNTLNRTACDKPTPLPVYSEILESNHMPKYSQAEVDSLKVEWQKLSEVRLADLTQGIHNEVDDKLKHLESINKSLILDKSILERKIADLQSNLLESRTDESCQIDSQIQILSAQIQESKAQRDILIDKHAQETAEAKSSTDKRISEMIKSHATSILSMQERVTADITATWTKRWLEEQAVSAGLRTSVQNLSGQVASFGEEKLQAVKEAKKKMYDKITLQFEAGNVKYEALKQSCKESQDGLLAAGEEITELKNSLVGLRQQLDLSQQEFAAASAALGEVGVGLESIISSLATASDESSANRGSASVDLFQQDVRVSILKSIQQHVTAQTAKVDAVEATCSELTTEINRLKEASLSANKVLSSINTEKEELSESLSTAKNALDCTLAELQSSRQEKDSQMLVIANMITDKGQLDGQLATAKQESLELTGRCEDLRRMNDEVMSMLEKMYAEKA